MNSFKKFMLVAVLAVGAVGGLAVIDSPAVGTQHAAAQRPPAPKYYNVTVHIVWTPPKGGKQQVKLVETHTRLTWREASKIRNDYLKKGGVSGGWKYHYQAHITDGK